MMAFKQLFNVRIDLTAPGTEIVINRDHPEDVYVAIRNAFDHAMRKLQDYARRIHGGIKAHDPELRGEILRLNASDGYGFIGTEDGNEYYFHRFNVVHPEFDHLDIGDPVTFLEDENSGGRQANRVSRCPGLAARRGRSRPTNARKPAQP